MTRPKLRRLRRSAQLLGEVANSMVDAVTDAKMTARIGATIRGMGI